MAFTTPGTAVAGDVLTAAFWNSNVRDNLNEVAPFFAAWTSFTPALKGSTTNPVLGTGSSATGSYLKIGRLLIVTANITFGTSGVTNGSGIILMDLPASLTLSTMSTSSAIGSAALLDNSGNRAYNMTVTGASGAAASTQVLFRSFDATGGALFFYDNPIVIAASDSFRVQIICETTT
jgi:hypothetical protein